MSTWTRTRPRNQGAALTAFELNAHGVPHTVIADNAGGHLMQHGEIDVCIVGSDRTTASGDVCNKIGTYLKALAASDNRIPFYAALPFSTIDWTLDDGVAQIPIEERDGREVSHLTGRPRRWRLRHDRSGVSGQPGGEPRLRRDPGPAGDGDHHRARRGFGGCGGVVGAVSGAALGGLELRPTTLGRRISLSHCLAALFFAEPESTSAESALAGHDASHCQNTDPVNSNTRSPRWFCAVLWWVATPQPGREADSRLSSRVQA